MANTFEDQAKERFLAASAFMDKAHHLLQDDLIYRSAIADGVSAIKNMLQGYLLLQIAATPASAVTQTWQEIAQSNSMPELITACSEAGLPLGGVAYEIRQLNSLRNFRAHDDPNKLIDSQQAARSVELARDVQRRIRLTLEGKPVAQSLPARAAQVARAAVSGHLRRPADHLEVTSTHPETLASLDATPALVEDQPEAADEVLERSTDTDEVRAMPREASSHRRRRRFLSLVAAAVLVLAGAASGAGIAVPIATGHTPGWAAFIAHALPTGVHSSPATPAVHVESGASSKQAGPLQLTGLPCNSGRTVIALHNLGNAPLEWALGSPDDSHALFSTFPQATGTPSASGILGPGGTLELYASTSSHTSYHVVAIGPAGALQVTAQTC